MLQTGASCVVLTAGSMEASHGSTNAAACTETKGVSHRGRATAFNATSIP